MARFISRRLLLSLITLWLLATIVFVIANVLPNDVGRTILGPFAPQESVDALNERLGHRPADPRPVRRLDGRRRHARLRRLVRRPASRSCRTLVDAIGPLGQAGRRSPCCSRSRWRSPPGCSPRGGATEPPTGRSSCSA